MATLGYNLCQNRERDFLWRHRADVQPNRRTHFPQLLFISTFFTKFVEHDVRAPLAANHADIIGIRSNRRAQTVLVLLMSARNDSDGNTAAMGDCFAHCL